MRALRLSTSRAIAGVAAAACIASSMAITTSPPAAAAVEDRLTGVVSWNLLEETSYVGHCQTKNFRTQAVGEMTISLKWGDIPNAYDPRTNTYYTAQSWIDDGTSRITGMKTSSSSIAGTCGGGSTTVNWNTHFDNTLLTDWRDDWLSQYPPGTTTWRAGLQPWPDWWPLKQTTSRTVFELTPGLVRWGAHGDVQIECVSVVTCPTRPTGGSILPRHPNFFGVVRDTDDGFTIDFKQPSENKTVTAPDGTVTRTDFTMGGILTKVGTQQADLALTATDTADPTTTSRDLTYTLRAANQGPSTASGVTVTNTVPENVTLSSATASQGSCRTQARTITCPIGGLASGGTATVTVVVVPERSTAGQTLQNTAQVTADQADPNPANNTVGADTLISGCAPEELSGQAWAARWPVPVGEEAQLAALADNFEPQVRTFISAMRDGRINVRVLSTLRPYERQYLMHHSWNIANGRTAPAAVPDFVPEPGQDDVNICWVHRNPDGTPNVAASTAAAQRLVQAFGIDPNLGVAPALRSRHGLGLAIDMTTTWGPGAVAVDRGDGPRPEAITTLPRNGLNAQLHNVGASYGVVHFNRPAADPNHWSDTGT